MSYAKQLFLEEIEDAPRVRSFKLEDMSDRFRYVSSYSTLAAASFKRMADIIGEACAKNPRGLPF